jgi:hypothetical protein
MIIELPSRNVDQLPDDERKKLTVMTHKPTVTFQWPPDCLWPFMDHELEKHT